jgi:hypothetical protein
MQEQPNVPLLIFLTIVGLGLIIAIGGFDDADVRDLENPHPRKSTKIFTF